MVNSKYLAFPFGADFPDETGKMSQSDKRGASAAEAKWILRAKRVKDERGLVR